MNILLLLISQYISICRNFRQVFFSVVYMINIQYWGLGTPHNILNTYLYKVICNPICDATCHFKELIKGYNYSIIQGKYSLLSFIFRLIKKWWDKATETNSIVYLHKMLILIRIYSKLPITKKQTQLRINFFYIIQVRSSFPVLSYIQIYTAMVETLQTQQTEVENSTGTPVAHKEIFK